MNAFDRGYDQYKTTPDLMLIEVCRIACSLNDDWHAFVEGYIAARKHHDEAQAESVS